jgi:hypothetical protein
VVALWNDALIFQDFDNPALPYLQEMKSSGFYVPACLSLGLHKPAATLMRAVVENALYFSYFRDHPVELRTAASAGKYYVDRTAVLEYHDTHTFRFKERQAAVGFKGLLNSWYSDMSSIVHGQVPGVWSSRSLKETAFDPSICEIAVEKFKTCVSIVNLLFLVTTPHEIWEGIRPDTRALFLKGLSAKKKQALLSL